MLRGNRFRNIRNLVALVLVVTATFLGTTDGRLLGELTSAYGGNLALPSPAATPSYSVFLPMVQDRINSNEAAIANIKPAGPPGRPATHTPTVLPTATPMASIETSVPTSPPAKPATLTPTPTPMISTTPPASTVIPTATRLANTVTPTPASSSLRLVFADEFGGTQLDPSKWQTQYWWGRTNPPELQYYAPDAFDLVTGLLRIKAEKRTLQNYSYTSGLISSYNSFHFTYGYVEARVKVPRGQGLWPAFWLLTDNHQSDSEIDVMEILGNEPQRVYTTLHYDNAQGRPQQVGSSYLGSDFSQDFHIFAVDWSPQAIIWYVDGVERYRVTQNVPADSMYLIANLAVGGGWPGNPDSSTVFPAYFDIDYIRVYQR